MSSPLATSLMRIVSVEDPRQLQELEKIVSSIVPSECGEPEYCALLGLFERFPESGGFGIFWSVVHLLEACAGYEPFLVESVRRKPVEFNVLMINRLLNGNISEISGHHLIPLLESVMLNSAATNEARRYAANFLKHQKSHDHGVA